MDWTFATQRYGVKWRRNRQVFHGQVHQGVAGVYQGAQLRGARRLLRQLLQDPNHLQALSRRCVLQFSVDVCATSIEK